MVAIDVYSCSASRDQLRKRISPDDLRSLQPHTIAEITKERVRRVIQKLDDGEEDKLNLKGDQKIADLAFSNWRNPTSSHGMPVCLMKLQRWRSSSNSTCSHIREGRTDSRHPLRNPSQERLSHLLRQLRPSALRARPSIAWRADNSLFVWNAN